MSFYVCGGGLYICRFLIISVFGEHAFKALKTSLDNVSCERWNRVLTVGGKTTESSKHFISRVPRLMKYCHVRRLLLWTLNYPRSHLEVSFPACMCKDMFYGLLLRSPTLELNLVMLHSAHVICIKFWNKQMTFYFWQLGQVLVIKITVPVLWLC